MPITEKDVAYFAKMTSAELDNYEKVNASYNHPDKEEYMAEVAKRRAVIAEEIEIAEAAMAAAAEVIQAERDARVYDLSKLDPYLKTPRSESQFVTDIAGKAPLFGKAKWKEMYLNAPIIYAGVVQANRALWDPGDFKDLPAVFLFALDDKHRYDIDWLSEMTSKIQDLKKSGDVPADCAEFIKTLRNDQSYFCFKVGASIAGAADLWCATYTIDKQAELPNKALPGNGIVPFILKAQPKKNSFVQFKMIPAKYYSKS